MICNVCGKQKANAKERRSSLIQMTYWSCGDCFSKNYEPRHYVILAGRARGPAFVADFITKRRYVGDEILATEIIK